MKFRTRPGCYFNCGKASRMPQSHFCSDKCAAEWAEAIVEGNDDNFCFECQQWFSSGMLHNKECSTRKIPKAMFGVHQTHCCLEHGCKYGEEDCPVVNKKVVQIYKCENC